MTFGFMGLGHRILGEASTQLGPDPQPAERALSEAVRIQQESSARRELARSHVSYARLIEARGERGQARDHLTRAIGMFREMGMAWDLARGEQPR